ncbi:DNA-3-methyladenine glycosylase I, partial [Georgenia sp. 10Sc9-8]|nr:DNA-3-methyladenine glycosylase I [Georgenia halotolerans]
MSRCFGEGDPLYADYHDHEWGRPLPADLPFAERERLLFERVSLEAFQSGLSWITILRKRPAFREVFAGFEPRTVAAFDDAAVDQLLTDTRIVRNGAKIRATIANARALLDLHAAGGSLGALLRDHTPARRGSQPPEWSALPARTEESAALARALAAAGFRFVGPTTAYATMQAVGVVNDHVAGCP